MQYIKNIWNWVVYSSADSNKLSLTLKGIAGFILAIISYRYGIQNYSAVNSQVTMLIDMLITALQDAITLISIGATIYGTFRKIILTAQGTADTLPQNMQ